MLVQMVNFTHKNRIPMTALNNKEIKHFKATTECNVCDKQYNSDDMKVKYHCIVSFSV